MLLFVVIGIVVLNDMAAASQTTLHTRKVTLLLVVFSVLFCSIVDTAGSSQMKKGPLEARSGVPTEPSMDTRRLEEPLSKSTGIQDSRDVVNWQELTRRMDSDEDFVKEVVEAWLVDNPNSMAALVNAVKAKHVADITSLAHAIKGSAAVISAHALVQTALQLEIAGMEGELGNAETLLTDIQTEFDRLASFISRSDWMEIAKTQSSQWSAPGA